MRTHILAAVAAVAALGVSAPVLRAQGTHLGGQLSFAQDVNAGLGLRLEQGLMPPRSPDLRLIAAFDYYFPDEPFRYWELNGDVAWNVRAAGTRLGFFLGGGATVARSAVRGIPGSGDTEVNGNLLFGMRFFTASRVSPYLQLKPELGGANRLVVSTGVMF